MGIRFILAIGILIFLMGCGVSSANKTSLSEVTSENLICQLPNIRIPQLEETINPMVKKAELLDQEIDVLHHRINDNKAKLEQEGDEMTPAEKAALQQKIDEDEDVIFNKIVESFYLEKDISKLKEELKREQEASKLDHLLQVEHRLHDLAVKKQQIEQEIVFLEDQDVFGPVPQDQIDALKRLLDLVIREMDICSQLIPDSPRP